MASDYKWQRPTVLTRTMRTRLERLAELARHHEKPSAPAALLGITVGTLRKTVHYLTGSSSWPAVFEDWLFDLPVELVDDEAETADTIRTKLKHWLKATDTADKDFAQVCSTGAGRVRVFVEGRDALNPALVGRMLAKMRGAPWGYYLGKRRPMPLDCAAHGPAERPLADPAALQARIDADQAKRFGDRMRWLEIEQQKYRLPKRGKLPEEMVA
jgi:hypothetical protein